MQTGERVDGRVADEVRPLMVKPNYLPRVHGSGLFQRGQTQVLSICTLGMLNEWQRLDTIEPVDGKRYIHHYNFPPFCTGETGRMGAPKRRALGHVKEGGTHFLIHRLFLPALSSSARRRACLRLCPGRCRRNSATCGWDTD